MYTGLLHGHSGLAYIFILSTTISMILSFVTKASGPKPGVIKLATILARFVETSCGGLIGLIGIGVWVKGTWPITTWWLWVAVLGVGASGALIARGIKPALQSLSEGSEDQAGKWVGLAVGHWALVLGLFGLMHAFSVT